MDNGIGLGGHGSGMRQSNDILHLTISQCFKQTKSGDWAPVKNVKLQWRDINYIKAKWERPTSKSIRKNVLVSAGKKDVYLIDPDIYDVFFLEKKLQKYQRQYGSTNKR